VTACICQQSGLYVIQVQGVMYRSTRHMLLPYLMLNFPRLCVPLIAAGNQHPIRRMLSSDGTLRSDVEHDFSDIELVFGH